MMQRLWHDIRAHRLAAVVFVLCWFGIWVIAAMMQPQAAGLLQFLLVFVASVFVGWRQMPATATRAEPHLNDSIKHGFLVAALVMEIDLVIIWVADRLSASAVETTTAAPWWGAVLGVLAFFLGFGLIAGVAGMIGGLLGGAMAYLIHRWRHGGDPAAPAGVS